MQDLWRLGKKKFDKLPKSFLNGSKKWIQCAREENGDEDEHAIALHSQEDSLPLWWEQGKKNPGTVQRRNGDEIECHEHDIGLRIANQKV